MARNVYNKYCIKERSPCEVYLKIKKYATKRMELHRLEKFWAVRPVHLTCSVLF